MVFVWCNPIKRPSGGSCVVGANGGIGDYIAKPTGILRRTFERALKKIRRAEDIVDMYEALLPSRI
jgi:hypothetical protein